MSEKKEILFVLAPPLMNGQIFDSTSLIRSKEITRPMQMLKEHFSSLGFDLKTADKSSDFKKAFAIIFAEVPSESNIYYSKAIEFSIPMYLWVGEPPATVIANHDFKKHLKFNKVLTFNSDFIDQKKYYRIDYTIPIMLGEKVTIPKTKFSEKKLLCLVSSNKFSSYEFELYSERVNAIKYMEKCHSSDFDLYGVGWEKPIIHSRLASKFKINGIIWRFWPNSVKIKQFKTYLGSPKDKSEVFSKYKFTIAYENCITPGYISEKILEAMLYGTIPIYLGDPEIEKRIPKSCFIDKREFSDYDSLYNFISSMDEDTHEKYLENISSFLNSDKIYPFTINSFIKSFESILIG